jgi:hypothetical protein
MLLLLVDCHSFHGEVTISRAILSDVFSTVSLKLFQIVFHVSIFRRVVRECCNDTPSQLEHQELNTENNRSLRVQVAVPCKRKMADSYRNSSNRNDGRGYGKVDRGKDSYERNRSGRINQDDNADYHYDDRRNNPWGETSQNYKRPTSTSIDESYYSNPDKRHRRGIFLGPVIQ